MESEVLKGLFYIALLCGVVTTLVVSALNIFIAKAAPRWVLPCVACVVTLVAVQVNLAKIQDVQEFLLKSLLTMSFSVLFYTYLGKWFIDELFNWLKTFIITKLGGLTSNTETLPSPSQEKNSSNDAQVPQEKTEDSSQSPGV